ncbi:unnamed protein product, partial [Rotaria sordida]
WEIDLYCHADDCSRPDLFKEVRSQLTLSVGDLSAFDKELSTTTQSTTTRSTTTNSGGPQSTTTNPEGTSSTTTNPEGIQSTTTNPEGTQSTTSNASIFTRINLFSVLLISILLLNFH